MESSMLCVLLCLLCLQSISGQDPEYYLTLNGDVITNHSLVSMERIGEGLEALHCMTPHRPCCREGSIGEWYYPNGTAVPNRAQFHNLYRNRNNEGSVILNRRNNRLGPHGKYKCVIPQTGNNNESISLIVGIYSILAYPNIYFQPISLLNAVPGSRVSFSVRSSNALKYRWVYNEDVYLKESDKYRGVNSNTLEIVDVRETDEGEYHCVVEKELSVSSQVATLSVLDLPVITEQPVSVFNLLSGQDATFTLTASGMDLSYQWQYADGSPLQQSHEGVTTPTLTIRGVTRKDMTSYQCAVSNDVGTVLSIQVNLTLLQSPLIEVQPEHILDTQPGRNVSLTLLASGGDLTYLWQYADGSSLSDGYEGVTTPTLTILAVEEAGSYLCAVSNLVGTVFSNTVNVTVMKVPVQPVTSLNATPSITSVHLSWTPSPQDYLLFQVIYHHLAFPDLTTVVEVEEPRYTAVGLLPRGRYQFSVRQMRGSVMSGAVSVDVKLTENIPPVQAVTVEVLNVSSIVVSWDPLSPLPGWDISYYQVDVTSFTTGTPSQHIHAHTERTTNGNTTSAIVVSSDLQMVGGVDLVTEVRGVLDVGVDGVGLMEGEIAVKRTILEPEKTAFQLVLGPIDYCISWTDEKTFEIQSDIRTELVKVISEYCQCNFSINSISPGVFSCRQSANSVTYRSSVIGLDSDQFVSMIDQWVKTGTAAMVIRSFFVDVRNYEECPVQLKSILDPECTVNEQGSAAPRTLITSDPAVINCVNSCMTDSSTVSLCVHNP